MTTDENPTGKAYLKTFQALFQFVEIVCLLLAWSLLASEQFAWVTGFGFALGTFIAAWLISLFFFTAYITGLHMRLQASVRTNSGTTSGTAENLTLPPEAGKFLNGSAWFVVEYLIYLVCDIFLFVGVCIVTTYVDQNSHFIAASIFGWLAVVVFMLHFCLLVRNTEGLWPHQCFMHCFGLTQTSQASATAGEEEAELLPAPSAPRVGR